MTRIDIDASARTVTTTFADGASVTARPSLDAESVARATSLGYRGSASSATWAMTRDHDALHTVLAESMGRSRSVALWMAAHPSQLWSDRLRLLAHREECTVLLVQRLINVGLGPVLAELQTEP